MKIHSDTLTISDIRDAVPSGCYLAGHYDRSGVDWASVHVEGSRKRSQGFTVRLSGSSKFVMQNLPDKAATYDEWGFFLAELFRRDDNAICGWYNGGEDFVNKTKGAFPLHHSVRV